MGKSKRVISFMSYNQPDFIQGLLDPMVKNHTIMFYAFIQHKGEYDPDSDTTDKDHIHLFIEPNDPIDVMELIDNSCQYEWITEDGEIISCPKDDDGNELPWKFVGCRFSKWEDWLFYNLHLKWYLDMKGETREIYDYNPNDMITSDSQEYEARYYMAYHTSEYYKQYRVLQALHSGLAPIDLIEKGTVPFNQAPAFLSLEKLMRMGKRVVKNKDWFKTLEVIADDAGRIVNVHSDQGDEVLKVIPCKDDDIE